MHAYVVLGTTLLQTVATYNYTVIACIAGVPAGVPISSVEERCTNPQTCHTLLVSGDKDTRTILLKIISNIPSFSSSTLWNGQNSILLCTYPNHVFRVLLNILFLTMC